MRILITGSRGQLGSELLRILRLGHSEIGKIPSRYMGAEAVGVDVHNLDIADSAAVAEYMRSGHWDLIVHCAAMTNVDTCEKDVDTAMKVNALGARNMAMAAKSAGCAIAHISTDYVFSGHAEKPYAEWDTPCPHTVYGKAKLLGEQYVQQHCPESFLIRTSWLYGYTGGNFVKTILRAAKENGTVRVVNDQMGTPTNAADLAHHILLIADTKEYGIYHCAGHGVCSWYDFAREALRLSGMACEIHPCSTEEFPRPAPRPKYSALDNAMLRCTTGDFMRSWKEALEEYMQHYNKHMNTIE